MKNTLSLTLVLLGVLRAVRADGYEPSYSEMMAWGRNDFYGALGVKSDMPQKELGRFYRKLSVQLHPDKNRGREDEVKERFQEVAAAYAVLKNPERRAAYDKFFMSIPSSFRPKFDEKPVFELRTLVLLSVSVISVLQYVYWGHRRQGIIDLMMKSPQWRNQLAKATRDGKTVKISGAEPAEVTATIFFTLPLLPVYFCPWAYHLLRWLFEQCLLQKDISPEEEKYWMMRKQGWEEQEYEEHVAKMEAYYEQHGGKEAVLAQQEAKMRQMKKRYERYEKYGR